MALLGENMNLREYLFLKRLSVTDFSKLVDSNRAYISSIMHGRIKPGKRLAKEIERATNGEVTVDELLKDKDNKDKDNKDKDNKEEGNE